MRIVIVLEGGLVQGASVIADAPDGYTVIDYDDEGIDPADLTLVPQHDAERALAYVYTEHAFDPLHTEIADFVKGL